MILGTSRKTQRIARRVRRASGAGTLNLTSLMDIFTILVFFLMASSSNVEVLPNPKALQLPESIARQHARETVVVMVTEQDILVQNRRVMGLADAENLRAAVLPSLKAELSGIALREVEDAKGGPNPNRGEVTIMADREIPYSLLKKVMATCTDAKFAKISLAVIRREPGAT